MNAAREITVALASDQGYFPGLVVTIESALSRTQDARLSFLVIDGGLDAASRAYLEGLVAARAQGGEVRFLRSAVERFSRLPAQNRDNYLTYSRLLLDQLAPEVSRLVYLDVDIHLGRSLSEVAEIDLGGGWGAAAQCGGIRSLERDHPVEAGFGPPKRPYFNAGLIHFDLEVVRARNLFGVAMDYILRNRESVQWHDQSGLNAVGGASVVWLPLRHNVFSQLMQRLRLPSDSPVNAHYTSRRKPWQAPYEDHTALAFYRCWLGLVETAGEPPHGAPVTTLARRFVAEQNDPAAAPARWAAYAWFYRLRSVARLSAGRRGDAFYDRNVAGLLRDLRSSR